MKRSRLTALFAILAVVAVIAVGGWVAAARIESPAEIAARTAPPKPSLILVPVEKRVLSSNIVTRGTARFGLPQPISIAPSTLKSGTAGLITTLPAVGAQFGEGDVLLTASGRPVLLMAGAIPAYRDLVPGLSGKDVRQLEDGLKRLGFDPGPVDGAYDEQTSSAVAAWYKAAGHEPFGPTPEQLAGVRTLESALADAEKLKMSADSAIGPADLAVEAARKKAEHARRAADAEVQAAIRERDAASLDRGAAASVEVARAALDAAITEGEFEVQSAIAAKKIAEFEAQLAADGLKRSAAELEAARRALGVQVPADEIVFIPALPVRVQETSVPVGAEASGPVMSVTDNKITIDSSLALDAAPLVKPGMQVDIDEAAFGIKTKGVVEHVANTPGTHGVDGYHIYLAVGVDEPPTQLDGFSLRLTIPIRSTGGPVTAVPMSAVSLSADGTSRVQVEDNGQLSYVVVEPGLAAHGSGEVTARDRELEPGQLVVIGAKDGEPAPEVPAEPVRGSADVDLLHTTLETICTITPPPSPPAGPGDGDRGLTWHLGSWVRWTAGCPSHPSGPANAS